MKFKIIAVVNEPYNTDQSLFSHHITIVRSLLQFLEIQFLNFLMYVHCFLKYSRLFKAKHHSFVKSTG